MYFCGFICYFFYFWYCLFEISLLFMMNLKSRFRLWWIWPKVYPFYLFREWDLRFLDIFYFISLYFIYFCPNLYGVFPSTNAGFCSSCSSFLRDKVMLLEIFFSGLLRKTFITIIFIFGGAFTQSYRFWIAVFPFHLSPDN